MKFKKMLAIFLSAALFVTAFAGCGKKKADGITVQIGPNPETLDPALNSAVDGGNMLITLFETLLIIDQDNKVQPGQAEKYEVSPDGLTWTFTMRDGLKWSDGTDLNAKDFEYTFKRIADTNVAAPYAETVIGMIEGYKEAIDSKNPEKLNVKASDDGKTLTIKLAYPCSYFDKIVAFGTMSPVQKATVEKNGDSWATKPETYVCNGPYTITEWTPSEKIVCKKNENYKGGWDSSKIVNDKLTFLLLEDSSASYTAYTFFLRGIMVAGCRITAFEAKRLPRTVVRAASFDGLVKTPLQASVLPSWYNGRGMPHRGIRSRTASADSRPRRLL